VAAVAGVLAAWSAARADGFGLSLNLDPAYTIGTQETRDQLGHTTTQEQSSFAQSYRLAFDRQVSPVVLLSLGAQLQDHSSRSRTDGLTTTSETVERGLNGRLALALPVLSGGVTYDLGDASTTGSPALLREEVAGYLSWRPVELPELNARLVHSHHYDATRTVTDQTNTGALLSVRYQEAPIEAKYVLLWSRPQDGLTGTVSSSLDQVAQATYSDKFFEERTAVYLSATLRNQVTRTLMAGTGDLTLQQHPVAGLSLIEVFPVQPADAVLVPNPAVVDGNLTASAGVDVGYALSVAGDLNRRDLGLQFGDLLTPVNQLQVWVDRKLPPLVAAAYAWSVWQSDDNKTWTQVPIAGPVVFGPFQNAFQIPILETRARFLKVVSQPLQAGITTDPAYASVLVTELQAFLVTAASAAPQLQASSGAAFSGTASTLVWARANLTWDLTATMERRLTPDATLWSMLNGLNGYQPLGRTLLLSERLSRQDGDYGLGRMGQTDWTIGLGWKPLTTFSGTLAYSGSFVDQKPVLDLALGRYVSQPGGWTNSASALARADLYEGISMQLNLNSSFANDPDGKNTWSSTLNTTASLVPNPYLTLSLGWISTYSTVFQAYQETVNTVAARADASVNARVSSALSASATISRRLTGPTPTTSGTAQLNYAPLRGDLQLTAAYSNTFDTASQSTLRNFSPGLRWYVRPGVQFNAAYSMLDTSSPVSQVKTRLLSVGLGISL
jgi:hypothetical protein